MTSTTWLHFSHRQRARTTENWESENWSASGLSLGRVDLNATPKGPLVRNQSERNRRHRNGTGIGEREWRLATPGTRHADRETRCANLLGTEVALLQIQPGVPWTSPSGPRSANLPCINGGRPRRPCCWPWSASEWLPIWRSRWA